MAYAKNDKSKKTDQDMEQDQQDTGRKGGQSSEQDMGEDTGSMNQDDDNQGKTGDIGGSI
ncbi:MAG: hypothetical protein Q7K54_02600 [Candidatus Parcubacteria bacterium]|nr:hypothetical protein [Candidatus Parcubacteria bacterium]